MFDIDKKGDEYGRAALHLAVKYNNPTIVELLLKEYHANPNVLDNDNWTTLMYWAIEKDRNLSILTLLGKYGLDFARLVNQRSNQDGRTVFHVLCGRGNTDHNISCIKHLFSICEKIPNCSINILARDNDDMCGLHDAISEQNIDMTRYLLENVYFPNNDKLNKDGIAFINMRVGGHISLGASFMEVLAINNDRNVKRDLEMFKLLVSHGMTVNSEDNIHFAITIGYHYKELVEFILHHNLCPISTFKQIIVFMYPVNAQKHGSVNTEILKALYKYGLEHGLLRNKFHHSQIITEAAKYKLTTFKTTLSMILENYGIKDIKQYKQCEIIDKTSLKNLTHLPNTKPNVKSFIKALMGGDETKLLKLDDAIATSSKVVVSCINNHELKNNNENKILNYTQMCPICGDNGDGSQSLSGFECDECKSFICDDCIIVQKISKTINDNGNNKSVLLAAANEILEHKNNKKLLNKVQLLKF